LSRIRARVGHCVALYRKPAYSPRQHLANDTAILDAVAARLARRGWRLTRWAEDDLVSAPPPPADLYLNMCQGARASERLLELERSGATLINSPLAVLRCHRHRLAALLAHGDVEFPRTVIVPTRPSAAQARAVAAFGAAGTAGAGTADRVVWVKRGDVHAERPSDVVRARPEELDVALAGFAARGIELAALQEHVPGPVIKFYGIADRSFFRYYDAAAGPAAPAPALDERSLRSLAFRAARRLGLLVFGGDAVLAAGGRPVLIDLNDWPSFAPFREAAAAAIARFADRYARAGVAA